MGGILRLFFAESRARAVAIVACLVVAGVCEALGVAALLPLVTIAVGDPGDTGAFGARVAAALDALGIERSVGPLLAVVAGALILKSLLQAAAMVYVGFASTELVTALRERVVTTLLEARWGFLLGQRMGRLSNVLAAECSRAGELYVQTGLLLSLAIQAALTVAVAFAVSWQVALGGLLVGGAIAAALRS